MNRNDFLNIMGNSVSVDRQMIGEVYELIDIFPYFQSAHLLLLKGLYKNSDVKFENQLRQSAIYAGDRGVLYWLLQNSGEAATSSENLTYKNPEVNPESDTEASQTDSESPQANTDSQQTVIESAKNSDFLIDEIEKNSREVTFDESAELHNHSVMVATEPDNLEPDGVIYLNEESGSQPEEIVFFMDPGFSIPDNSDLLELDLEDEKFILDEERSVQVAMEPDKTSRRQIQSELIDRFIIANPRIEPQRDKNFVPDIDISKPFVEESDGLVTETLAKIYVCQGYYSKAIDIYEKLSLKFPEKSSYFASQIEKVKAYIKK
jgi:tetratricopeptide (TPR) repeat protein